MWRKKFSDKEYIYVNKIYGGGDFYEGYFSKRQSS